jgi:hypothetical protein
MKDHSKKALAGLLTTSFVLAAGTPVFAAANITVEARYFSPDLTFTAQSDDIDYNGGSVDFKNDLGIGDKKAPEYRIQFGDNLRLNYTKFNYKGSATISESFTYGGTDYQVLTDVDSELGIDYARLTWLLPLTKSERLETKWLIDIKGFKFDTTVTGQPQGSPPGTVVTETEEFAGAVPSIGFAGNLKLDKAGKLQGFAEISGIPLGKYGNFYDAEVGLKCKVAKDTSVNVGYRIFDLDVKDPDSNEQVRFKLAGMFYGLDHKF